MRSYRAKEILRQISALVLILILVVPVVFLEPVPVLAADANTKLLLHANGTDATTTFKDYSDSAHTVSVNGNAQIDTAQSKFGGASYEGDGSGDGLQIASHADWAFGTGDFTVDFWLRPDVFDNTYEHYVMTDASPIFRIARYRSGASSGKLFMNINGVEYIFNYIPNDTGVWRHIAIVRESGTVTLFVDGVSTDSTTTLNGSVGQGALYVGAYLDGSGFPTDSLDGHIDELRVSKGIARWTENFTPPTSEYDSGEEFAATGGTITYADGYIIHTFTSSGTFEITSGSGDVEYLAVAGGGGGGGSSTGAGGGGGAGGYLTSTISRSVGAYTVTVGAGGAAGATNGAGGVGGDSVFDSVTASGGGGGGGGASGPASSGGSGGGGRNAAAGASGTVGQGNDGGDGAGSPNHTAGGGGGAGAVGGDAVNPDAGAGGDGLSSSITGSAVTRAGGGGGGAQGNVGGVAASGGSGGGGAGSNSAAGTGGTANTGGGGGGGGFNGADTAGGAGGSGVVIVRYEDPRTFEATGGTIIEKDGYIIHTFTSSDTFEVTQGSANVEYLVVGGGGGGASNSGGGGGGGMLTGTVSRGVGSYTVTIGAGGTAGESGDNSVFDTITATGGGGGGLINVHAGRDGGSGGGGSGFNNNAGGSGTEGQGNDGGTGVNSSASTYGGGGGGGAGEAGANAVVGTAGDGGDGLPSSISGTQNYYAGGGGGRGFVSNTPHGSSGGLGGGGDGGAPSSASSAGAANTGGGGGSSSDGAGVGGSGIVIVRYLDPEPTRTIRLTGVVRLINVRLR